MSFLYLGLSDEVLKAVEEAGYQEPTPIQRQAIPVALQGRDILGIAQTGTGKTAAFTLPMIDILSEGVGRARMPRSLILEPTRELAAQVAENFEVYGKYRQLSKALLIGGVSFSEQDRLLERGVDVLIATPGRLLDHFERGKLMLSGVDILVIDEADRMLDMGFIPDIERILTLMPQRHQTLFFSATMPPEIKRLTDKFLKDPKTVQVAKPASAALTVTQAISYVGERQKRAALRALINAEEISNGIIFCNTKREVDTIYKSLKRHGFSAGQLHGDMDQSARMDTLKSFKDNEIQLLVASDVAARGLDIPKVSHVFNFDVPTHAEDYVHRIGRTGRAGREGKSFTLARPKTDTKFVEAIERLTGSKIPEVEVPGVSSAKTADVETGTEETKGSGRTRKPRSSGSKAETQPAADKPKAPRKEKENGGRSRQRESDKPVVGMGDHVPAFLMRGRSSAAKSK